MVFSSLLHQLVLCSLPSVPAAPPALQQDLQLSAEVDRESLRLVLLGELEELVTWCREKRALQLLEETFLRILELDPDHARARGFLGYKQQRGQWVLARTTGPWRNKLEEHGREGALRLGAAMARYSAGLHALLESEYLQDAELEQVEELILDYFPDDLVVHARRGEVPMGGAWVMLDTQRSQQQQAGLQKLIRDALADASAGEASQPAGIETQLGLRFHVAQTERMRALSTGALDEALELTRVLPVAQLLFNTVLQSDATLPYGLRLFLLAEDAQRDIFLENYPGLEPAYREELKLVTGCGLRGTQDWTFWRGDQAKRKDGIVRMCLAYLLFDRFEVGVQQGWLFEGLGIYLTHALLGTRLSSFQETGRGQLSAELMAQRTDLTAAETNWMQAAQELFHSWNASEYEDIFAKPVHAMQRGDLLASYATAAYLIEARPDALLRIIQQAPGEVSSAGLLKRELGLNHEQLLERLKRWIAESQGEEFIAPVEEAKLWGAWRRLDAAGQKRAVELFQSKLHALDTPAWLLQQKLLASGPESFAMRQPAAFYSPTEHAALDPIPRRWLPLNSSLLRAAREQILSAPAARSRIDNFVYDWGSGRVLQIRAALEPAEIFENALNGFGPDLDRAHALALAKLDGGQLRFMQAAFEHAYTDRDGGVYPGIRLYDAWLSRTEIEMPDVDVLGIYHDISGDWKSYVAPLPGSLHGEIYGILEAYFERVRGYRDLRVALADCLLEGEPERGRFSESLTNLHAFWAELDSDAGRAGALLPGDYDRSQWLRGRIELDQSDTKSWTAGQRRRAQWAGDAERIRLTMAQAIEETLAK